MLTYSDTAPIEGPLKPADLLNHARRLRVTMNAFVHGSGGFAQHQEDADWVIGKIEETAASDATDLMTGKKLAYVYKFQNVPVALLVGDFHQQAFDVDYLVAHPGASAAGGAMIECAVNLSYDKGFLGHVKLVSLAEAEAAYMALGFKKKESGVGLVLMPASSDLWTLTAHGYVLSKYQGKQYVTHGLQRPKPPLPPKPTGQRKPPSGGGGGGGGRKKLPPLPPRPLPNVGGSNKTSTST